MNSRLTVTQRDVLADIRETGKADGGRGWAIHTQRTLDSLVRRGLVASTGDGRWKATDQGRDDDRG